MMCILKRPNGCNSESSEVEAKQKEPGKKRCFTNLGVLCSGLAGKTAGLSSKKTLFTLLLWETHRARLFPIGPWPCLRCPLCCLQTQAACQERTLGHLPWAELSSDLRAPPLIVWTEGAGPGHAAVSHLAIGTFIHHSGQSLCSSI